MNIGWGNSEAADVDAILRQTTTARWQDDDGQIKTDNSYEAGLDYLWDGTKARFLLQAGLTGDIKINDKFAGRLRTGIGTSTPSLV